MKNTLLNHPNGGLIFGQVIGVNNPHYAVETGSVILKHGIEKGQGSFGAVHIWHRHERELSALGYATFADVPRFVADIVRPQSPVLINFSRQGRQKLITLRSPLGMAVLQPKGQVEGILAYSVITAYTKVNPKGQQVTTIR